MSSDRLRIPKKLKQVTLWVHPLGPVIGSLFLREQSVKHAGEEEPLEVLNQVEPFVVLQRDEPDELRFYNRGSIIRVEYSGEIPGPETARHMTALACQLHMMDGSLLKGTIYEQLPPDHSRLFDYLNQDSERFIRMYVDESTICLINKSYIIQVNAAKGESWNSEDK